MAGTTVTLLHVGAPQGIEYKYELIAAGLVLDQDFTWKYNQATYNNDGYTAVTPRSVTFNFQNPALATFYKLKWQKENGSS